MKLEKWDPDLRTLLLRFQEGRLDLQPAFQRGLVWPPEKKARLIDTALRSWTIPPIHLIREPNGTLSVLDGQQRLAAFFEFLDDKFAVREFSPMDEKLSGLAGLKFSKLTPALQYKILDTRVPAFEIFEFSPDEPYELFFRLNHPTGLTAAEKRNALAGTTRAQVRELVDGAVSLGWKRELLGFSESRGSYDDVIARVCRYVEFGSLELRLSMNVMEEFYREPNGISEGTVRAVRNSILHLTHVVQNLPTQVRFNKATLVTWLLIAARAELATYSLSAGFSSAIVFLERSRVDEKTSLPRSDLGRLVDIYRDRASLRVADVLSVGARDAIAGFLVDCLGEGETLHPATHQIIEFLKINEASEPAEFEAAFLELASATKAWGVLS